MENAFNPCEILEIAIDIEENGRRAYGSFEEKARDPKVKEIWAYLKGQEIEHKKNFQNMLDERKNCGVQEFVPGEYEGYLRAIASDHVFISKAVEEKIKKGFSSDLEAIDFGIKMEKDSILVYSAFSEALNNEEQAVLNRVIAQEREHLIKFTELKTYLRKGGRNGG